MKETFCLSQHILTCIYLDSDHTSTKQSISNFRIIYHNLQYRLILPDHRWLEILHWDSIKVHSQMQLFWRHAPITNKCSKVLSLRCKSQILKLKFSNQYMKAKKLKDRSLGKFKWDMANQHQLQSYQISYFKDLLGLWMLLAL